MRYSRQKAEELEEKEHTQRTDRNNGLGMVSVRDKGWHKFDNGTMLLWHVDTALFNGEVRAYIPPGHFVLEKNGEKTLFDADEFRKYLRWA